MSLFEAVDYRDIAALLAKRQQELAQLDAGRDAVRTARQRAASMHIEPGAEFLVRKDLDALDVTDGPWVAREATTRLDAIAAAFSEYNAAEQRFRDAEQGILDAQRAAKAAEAEHEAANKRFWSLVWRGIQWALIAWVVLWLVGKCL